MGAVFGSHAEARTPASEVSGDVTSSSEAAAAGSHVDVTVILDKAVARKKEKLAWRTSIVDLLGQRVSEGPHPDLMHLQEELRSWAVRPIRADGMKCPNVGAFYCLLCFRSFRVLQAISRHKGQTLVIGRVSRCFSSEENSSASLVVTVSTLS